MPSALLIDVKGRMEPVLHRCGCLPVVLEGTNGFRLFPFWKKLLCILLPNITLSSVTKCACACAADLNLNQFCLLCGMFNNPCEGITGDLTVDYKSHISPAFELTNRLWKQGIQWTTGTVDCTPLSPGESLLYPKKVVEAKAEICCLFVLKKEKRKETPPSLMLHWLPVLNSLGSKMTINYPYVFGL